MSMQWFHLCASLLLLIACKEFYQVTSLNFIKLVDLPFLQKSKEKKIPVLKTSKTHLPMMPVKL